MKFFFILEYVMFFFPIRFMKLFIGLWILYPTARVRILNFEKGEKVLYTMFEEKLEDFESFVAIFRDSFLRKLASGSFKIGAYFLKIGMKHLSETALHDLGVICEEMKTELRVNSFLPNIFSIERIILEKKEARRR